MGDKGCQKAKKRRVALYKYVWPRKLIANPALAISELDRCICGKVIFYGLMRAIRHIREIKNSGKLRLDAGPISPYRCRESDFWHIGHHKKSIR